MSHIETPWSRVASRTARGLLVRKGITQGTLVESLRLVGTSETPRSIEGKLLRGTFKFSLFLQILSAIKSDHPAHWKPVVARAANWDDASARILRHELLDIGMPLRQVAFRLRDLGVLIDDVVLGSACNDGNFPLVLILQLCLVRPIDELDRLVDMSDIRGALLAEQQGKRSLSDAG
ncbi:DUF6471 domain-containing protein [Cupriavidus sp. U2]|uniref:DUF6471 domain-containing protein n=1 Tax=Cupriavidus sp. U2 TaxID=2920269 RepID=UPI00129E19F2|nr:DUF6471 domain-containing protein [Cupriavidus sp. U2]